MKTMHLTAYGHTAQHVKMVGVSGVSRLLYIWELSQLRAFL